MDEGILDTLIQQLQRLMHHEILPHKTTYVAADCDEYRLYEIAGTCAVYQGKSRCMEDCYHTLEEMRSAISLHYVIREIHEESYFYISDISEEKVNEHVTIQVLKEHHVEHLNLLKLSCEVHEVDEADVDMEDYMVFGAFHEGNLASAASIIYMNGVYDIGVLTMPMYRLQGITTQLVQHCANWVLRQGVVCQYRCDNSNTASYHTALAAGFTLGMRVCHIKVQRRNENS